MLYFLGQIDDNPCIEKGIEMKNFILHSKSYKTYEGAIKATEKAVVKYPWLLDQCVRFVVVATPEGRFQTVVWDAGPLSNRRRSREL